MSAMGVECLVAECGDGLLVRCGLLTVNVEEVLARTVNEHVDHHVADVGHDEPAIVGMAVVVLVLNLRRWPQLFDCSSHCPTHLVSASGFHPSCSNTERTFARSETLTRMEA